MDKIEEMQRRYMGLIGNNVINEVGVYDGKYNTTISLSSHILDVGIIGLNTYLYDSIYGDVEYGKETADVLTAALTLHDVDKVVNQKTDDEVLETDEDILERYFEDDWFGIEDFLSEHSDNPREEYFNILLYLIKRTEKRDEMESLPKVDPKYRRLVRYCELADSTVSTMTNNSLIKDGFDNLSKYHDEAQMIKLVRSESPIIHFLILESIEDILYEKNNVVLGSTPTGILYLGDEIDKEHIVEDVVDKISDKISKNFDFEIKAQWNTVNYKALPTMDLPIQLKRDIIIDACLESQIKYETAGTEKIENVPEEFKNVIPEATYRLYYAKDYDFKDEELSKQVDEIVDEIGGKKVKLHIMNKVVENYDTIGGAFVEECREYTDEFEEYITPESSPLDKTVNSVLGLEMDLPELPSADEKCFLCGQFADIDYSGDRLYKTNSTYSRRTSAEQKKKLICSRCSMEDALIESLINSGYTDDITMVYLFFDNFSGSVGYEELADRYETDVLESDIAFDDETEGIGAVSLYKPLVHMQPVSLKSGPNQSDKNKKMSTVRDILNRIQDTGMKARITTPYKPFNPSSEVFKDANPEQPQLSIDATVIDTYEDVNDVLDVLDIGNQFHGATNESYPYQYIIPPTPENIIHNAERKFDSGAYNISYIEDYFKNNKRMIQMNEVAKEGFELVGYQYNSKHEKTKLIRESLDALLDARNKNFNREKTVEVVGGAAERVAETQSDYVESSTVKQFSEKLVDYCEEYDSLHELSNKKNKISDTYKFAYERVMDEHNNGDD